MTRSVVLGIDPGGASTGIVVRRGSDLLGHAVVTSDGPSTGLPGRDYLKRIDEAICDLTILWIDCWAMESVTPPRGFKHGARDPIHPGSLIGVSAVAGYLLAVLPGLVLVPPAGNGSRPLSTYPPALVGDREKRGTGILRHARSAWDVAGHSSVRRAT